MYRIIHICILLVFCVIQLSWLIGITVAADSTKISDLPNYTASSFELTPKVDSDTLQKTYDELSKSDTSHQFWDKYNKKAKEFGDDKTKWLAKQVATGVMNRDTIIAYSSVIIEFISNLWLVVGAGFIIWSGYQYAMSAFWTKEDKGSAIKNAFIGIAVIATSYGIFRLLTKIFIE